MNHLRMLENSQTTFHCYYNNENPEVVSHASLHGITVLAASTTLLIARYSSGMEGPMDWDCWPTCML